MSGIGSVNRDMHHGSRQVTGVHRSAHLCHQLIVADGNFFAVNAGLNAAPGIFLNTGHSRFFRRFAVGLAKRTRNRVGRKRLGKGGIFQQLRLVAMIRMHCLDPKHALRQRPRFIKDNRMDFCQHFHIVAALNQNTVFGCAADAAEKAERH